jgi:SAM-dependent methyltransferase
MNRRSLARRWRRHARGAASAIRYFGLRLGVLPYQPERWEVDQWSAAYEEGRLSYYEELYELARYSVLVGYVNWFGRSGSPRVLDVGCGVGLLRERLSASEFSQYVGIDVSAVAIEAARSRQYPRSQFLVGDLQALDDGPFDIVVLNEVLYYIPNISSFLSQLHRVLGPNSVVLVSIWRHPGDRLLWKKINRAFTALDRVAVRNPANLMNPRGWLVGAYATAGAVGDGGSPP